MLQPGGLMRLSLLPIAQHNSKGIHGRLGG
jgi:hypothetical protein